VVIWDWQDNDVAYPIGQAIHQDDGIDFVVDFRINLVLHIHTTS
jgi:hypothetical protein